MTVMPLSNTAYLMRERAESFGAVAALYDRYRPDYPDQVIDDLVALAAGRPILDIGTGTGKAARRLLARGCDVLGVEIDPQMAQVAREHGLTVEVGAFETWPENGRRFGLVIAAQAWHWVDPQVGAPKVAGLLAPGATFAPLWNFYELADPERDTVSAVYERQAPELVPNHLAGHRPAERPYVEDLLAAGAFAEVGTRTYRWSATCSVEHWVGRIGTHSDHLALGADRLTRLQAALGAALSALGPDVHISGGTYVLLAHVDRAEPHEDLGAANE